MAQPRPVLTVDVNAAHQSVRRAGPSKAMNTHAMASAQAPQANGQEQRQSANGIRPGDIISEDDLNEQGGFSSDEEGIDGYDTGVNRQQSVGRGDGSYGNQQYAQQEYSLDSQDFVDSDSSEGDQYGQEGEGELGSDEDDGQYDEEEEDELSSSPSIPDENIDFDLVYALHNFIATVEGQATVNKGNSLTLLDDSNSYWWLVRVLRTQEVGYIPAENIETPYERLARLNKHRNVDLTSATDDDHNQVPEGIITSHLVKQRSFGTRGISTHSGKLSALSRRNHGLKPKRLSDVNEDKRGVQFGPPTYLEHSGNEYSDEEEEDEDGDHDMIEMDEDEGELSDEEDEAVEGDRQEIVEGRDQYEPNHQISRGAMGAEHMEPDDGMDWDARESERVQRAQEERNAARQAAQNRLATQTENNNSAQQNSRAAQDQVQGMLQQQQIRQQTQQQQQQQQQMYQKQSAQQQQFQQSGAPRAAQPPQSRLSLQEHNRTTNRLSSSTTSSNGSTSGFLPSQVQASRDRASTDGNAPTVAAITSPNDSKRDRRTSHRKSRGEDDVLEEKQGKKRSGVFSGLFSRSKDKKERKSGHFSNSSLESDPTRLSEDSNPRQSLTMLGGSSSNAGRALQERDRIQQEAYQKQFLHDSRNDQRPQRPGSLIATPGSAPMLNVIRVFAGNDIDSAATFKTVLLNQSTTAGDLVRQAMQRFRLGAGHDIAQYCLTVKLVEGDERILLANEKPLQVFDDLSEAISSNNDIRTIPSVKRSSVGSISSISSNLSLNPAILRLENDFSDDHNVKFYLHRRTQNAGDSTLSTRDSNAFGDVSSSAGLSPKGGAILQLSNESNADGTRSSGQLLDPNDSINNGTQFHRFPLRLLIFPSDLPEGMVFDPQTNALVPKKVLDTRGPNALVPGEGVPQDYREKILALPRNTTVAEVVEQGLERFGILEGVVEGGDDVEDRSGRRRSKGRIRYGLTIKLEEHERQLQPSSRVVEAFPSAPIMRPATSNRRSKRASTDSAMLLNFIDDLRADDPIFILRQMQRQHHRSARPLSPTENILANRQDERRQAELGTVAPTPSNRALEEVRGGAAPADLEQQGMSRQEIIAAQRAAARERRAAVLGAQPNEENGVDVMLDDKSRLRSSKMLDTGRVRYSFIPVSGEEHDISAIVEDVLRTENASMNGLLAAPPRPTMQLSSRTASATTIEDYVSAPGSPIGTSPLSLREAHITQPSSGTGTNSQKNIRGAGTSDDAFERLISHGESSNRSVEEKIDQVLSRLKSGNGPVALGQGSQPQATVPQQRFASTQAQTGSVASSHDTASPTSGMTHPSVATAPTPLSTLTATAGSVAANRQMGSDASTGVSSRGFGNNIGSNMQALSSSSTVGPSASANRKTPLPSSSMTDFGISHLYAVAEAAARRKPPRKRPSKALATSSSSEEQDFRPTVAGLFPPQAPYIEDRRIKDAYSPIGKHLNGLEDTLDRLLLDAMRLS